MVVVRRGIIWEGGTDMTLTSRRSGGGPCVVRVVLLFMLMAPVLDVNAVHAASFQVTTNADSGPGSLRDAITQADGSPGATIAFDIGGGGAQTIAITTGLPAITADMTLDGTTQPGYAGYPLVTLDGGNSVITALTVDAGTTVSLTGLKIRRMDNRAIADAGSVTVSGCELADNVNALTFGGAVEMTGGSLVLTNSYVHDNTANNDGGAIAVSAGTATIDRSTVSTNLASGRGGGIFVQQPVPASPSALNVVNSTISGNIAGAAGGGISITNTDAATLVNTTVAANRVQSAGVAGGVDANASAGTMSVTNTIIATNTAAANPDVLGPGTRFTDGGHNLIGATDGTTSFTDATDQTGTALAPKDPGLLALANNSGPTPTQALANVSTAINAGNDAVCANTTGPTAVNGKDQRGVPRPQGAHCDIGAFEYLVLTLNSANVPTSGGSFALIGSGFLPGITLTVDGSPVPVTAVAPSGLALTATLPVRAAGTAVSAIASEPGAAASTPATLTYVIVTPQPNAVSPSSGSVAGGSRVTITGLYFAPNATVAIAGIPALNVNVINDTTITATTPPHAAGMVNITVTVVTATGTLAGGYTYGTVSTLPGSKPTGGAGGLPSALPVSRPARATGGTSPNPLPPLRP